MSATGPLLLLVLTAVLPPLIAQPAVVSAEKANVYASADAASPVRGELAQHQAVTVDLRIGGGSRSWCSVLRVEPRLTGYVECSALQFTQAPSPSSYRPDTSAKIDELIRDSGVARSLALMLDPAGFARLLLQRGAPADTARDLADAYASVAQPDLFLDPIRQALRRGFSHQHADASLAWWSSPAGQRMALQESQAAAGASPEAFQAFLRQPVPAARMALVERLWHSQDTSEAQIEYAIAAVRSVAEVLNPKLVPQRRLTEPALAQIAQDLRRRQPEFAVLSKAQTAYVYRRAPDGELAEYVRFAESPAGQWFAEAARRGALEGVQTFSAQLTRALVSRTAR